MDSRLRAPPFSIASHVLSPRLSATSRSTGTCARAQPSQARARSMSFPTLLPGEPFHAHSPDSSHTHPRSQGGQMPLRASIFPEDAWIAMLLEAGSAQVQGRLPRTCMHMHQAVKQALYRTFFQ